MIDKYSNRDGGAKTPPKPKKEKAKENLIQFIKSPTGDYKLAYNIGDIIDANSLNKELLAELKKNEFIRNV